MVLQDAGQQWDVREERLDRAIWQRREGVVGRCEHRERTGALERTVEARRVDRGQQGGESTSGTCGLIDVQAAGVDLRHEESGNREPSRLAELERAGNTLEVPGGTALCTELVIAVPVPVSCDRVVADVAEVAGSVSGARRQRVAPEELAGGWAVHGDAVDTVTVPVTREGDIPFVTEGEAVVRCSEAAAVGAELVDDEELVRRGSEHRDRVDTVTVPVPGDRNVVRITEEEEQVGDSLRVRIAQVDATIALAVDAGGHLAVAVPVTEDRDVTRVPEVERCGRAVIVPQMPKPLALIHRCNLISGWHGVVCVCGWCQHGEHDEQSCKRKEGSPHGCFLSFA